MYLFLASCTYLQLDVNIVFEQPLKAYLPIKVATKEQDKREATKADKAARYSASTHRYMMTKKARRWRCYHSPLQVWSCLSRARRLGLDRPTSCNVVPHSRQSNVKAMLACAPCAAAAAVPSVLDTSVHALATKWLQEPLACQSAWMVVVAPTHNVYEARKTKWLAWPLIGTAAVAQDIV